MVPEVMRVVSVCYDSLDESQKFTHEWRNALLRNSNVAEDSPNPELLRSLGLNVFPFLAFQASVRNRARPSASPILKYARQSPTRTKADDDGPLSNFEAAASQPPVKKAKGSKKDTQKN